MSSTSYDGVDRSEATGWVAWLLFAAILLITLGAFQAVVGLVALFDDGYFVVHRDGQLVPISYQAWGWIHLLLAAIAFVTGIGLMLGQLWARVVGVILTSVNIVVMFAFIGAYPWWAVSLIIFSFITMYAIVVHGREVADAYPSP